MTLSVDEKKRAIYEAMSPKRQKHINEKIGYDRWDPFEEPKDPIDIRKDQTRRTAQQLVREFLQSRTMEEYSNNYGRGVLEMAIGIVNDDDRFLAMYEFSLWHKALLEKESSTGNKPRD